MPCRHGLAALIFGAVALGCAPSEGARRGDAFVECNWMSGMDPVFTCSGPYDEEYSLYWWRAFHEEISVRVFRRGSAIQLEAVAVDFEGNTTQRVSKTLSRKQWSGLGAGLDRIGFWNMSERPDGPPPPDGSGWEIVAGRDDETRTVFRYLGADGLREAGLRFLDAAELEPPVDEIY